MARSTPEDANRKPTIAIKGSTRHSVPGVAKIGPADTAQKIQVSVYARQNPNAGSERTQIVDDIAAQWPRQRKYLNGREFERTFGADPVDIDRITNWAQGKGLRVLDANPTSRRVLIEGSVGALNAAFGTTLNEYEHPALGRFRGREGAIHVDESLFEVIEGVFGLDTRRAGRPRLRRLAATQLPVSSVAPAQTAVRAKAVARKTLPPSPWRGTFFPPQIAALYDYPAKLTGAGQNVAVFAFNGGNVPDRHGGYSAAALQAYFTSVLGSSMPVIKDVTVHGPGNFPGPDTAASSRRGDATGEVMLDLCVVGALVPRATLFVYFTEFTTQGWVDALHAAITDDNAISVISISYGNPEDDPQGAWTAMGVKLVDQAFEAAAAKGITICVASGDDGSTDQEASGAHVDFPASSPHVLAVGGTKLVAKNNAISKETVWNAFRLDQGAGGGGVSVVFTKPAYQDAINVPPAADPPHKIGRGVPDVAAVADPATGVVIIHVDGQNLEAIGGTSASAPLWASLIARINEGLKARVGFLNPLLYTKLGNGVLRDITSGNNGAYTAAKGWDACTGFGSPRGNSLLTALSGPGKSHKAGKKH